jgi:hypothetical protein
MKFIAAILLGIASAFSKHNLIRDEIGAIKNLV